MKTLVCVIGQIRIPELTWDRFKNYVLDELEADLALCLHDGGQTDRDNPYHKNAKYVFEYKNTGCWAKSYDAMNPGWRDLVSIPGDWIGNVKEPIERKGTGGVLTFLRWWLYQNLEKIEKYDRVVVTRSDWFWTAPHPTLDNDHIWIPNAEFHGGLCDRHLVIPSKYLKDALTFGQMENHIATGNNMIQLLNQRLCEGWGHFMYNVESFMYLRFMELGLLPHVGFFPLTMFLASDTLGTDHPQFNIKIRYPDELESSRETVTWPFRLEHTYISRHGMFCGRSIPC
jgi:hypothetical protein